MHPTETGGRSVQAGSSHNNHMGKIMGSSSTMSSLHLDPHYIVTFGGFLKLMQILFSALGLICILCASRTYYWYSFVALGALFITLILFAFYIFRVIERLHFALWIFPYTAEYGHSSTSSYPHMQPIWVSMKAFSLQLPFLAFCAFALMGWT
ncbi:unnamed protein product [Orchesella dallaii]|uniref:MARVEL domain-containing protein n=1 Tax=Orchesella dallaii TaxID=48710 RepID=A0ABP1RTN6_9HEXA